ncbi:MAG: hypothetical protein KGL40_09920 [Rhodocyclaceae bacterium]|nr:hypothetical protein [Rhodocyclaceae bacterium]
MKLLLTIIAVAALASGLGACGREKTPAAPAAASSEPQAAPSQQASPQQGVTPQPSDAPAASGATGPGEGSTAIGHPAAGQDKGGANTGEAPKPTGGDAHPANPQK